MAEFMEEYGRISKEKPGELFKGIYTKHLVTILEIPRGFIESNF